MKYTNSLTHVIGLLPGIKGLVTWFVTSLSVGKPPLLLLESLNGKYQLRYVDMDGEIILKRLFNMMWKFGLLVARSIFFCITGKRRTKEIKNAIHALSCNYRINSYACEQWILMQRQVSQNLFFIGFPTFIFTKSISFFPLSSYGISFSSMSCKWRLVYRYLTDIFGFGTWLIDWLIDWRITFEQKAAATVRSFGS